MGNIKAMLNKEQKRRRQILGATAATGLVIWHKPIIKSVILPAHAQTSGPVNVSAAIPTTALPDLVTVDINVPVSGKVLNTSLVTLSLDITHTFQGDLSVTLTSPQGTSAVVLNRVGTADSGFGCGQNDFDLTLADGGAALPINIGDCGPSPLTGTFAPGGGGATSPLSVFNGEDPNGTWVIQINDAAGLDAGTLNSGTLFVACV